MKKIVLCFILFFSFSSYINATKYEVTLNKCVDGDTAWFNLDNEKIKARFLAIDTPESTNTIEPYGKEASNYTCNKLKNAKKIEIEYDENSDKFDKYDRHLVWVFIDDKLLQEDLVKEGLAEVKYIYGDYKYLDNLKLLEADAKLNKLNIWNEDKYDYTSIILIIVFIIIICIFSKTYRKKISKKAKNKIKKNITKKIDSKIDNLFK